MIRKAADRDLERVMRIEEIRLSNRRTKEMFLYELYENESGHSYVLKENRKIVGFIDFWIALECCQLANIAVHPPFQRRGYSRYLMDFVIASVEQERYGTAMLEVYSLNEAACCPYDSYELMKVSIHKEYYNDNGEDAIVMCRALGGNLV